MKISVREAHPDDLPALLQIRYHDTPGIHSDRISGSDGQAQQYYVAEVAQQIVGFVLLVLERPASWSDALESFPILIDLFVAEPFRGQGIGGSLMLHTEEVARRRGIASLYLSVESKNNPRAMRLYMRRGYTPLQAQPYYNVWRFTDSDGIVHEGEEWVIDMRKQLDTPT